MSSPSPLTLSQLRQQFPALANKHYFNSGGQGPLPTPAREAIAAALRRFDELGPFSKGLFEWLMPEEQLLRQDLARAIGTTADRLALTESTIGGMNIAMWGVDWRAGDRLLLTDAEHYAVWEIAGVLRDRFGIQLGTCPLSQSSDPVARLADCLTADTRMVCVSHIFWNSGRILPLTEMAALCRERGVLLTVDAAQSAGVLPLDLDAIGADFYAFTGHKWFCGPAGVGALHISPRGQAAIQPTYTGWCKTYSKGGADSFEVSTAAYPLRLGLRHAIALHDRFAPIEERFERQVGLARSLWEQLPKIAGVRCLSEEPPESGLVMFVVGDREPAEVELWLEKRGVFVRSMKEPVALRASVHYFNTEEEIAALLEALADL